MRFKPIIAAGVIALVVAGAGLAARQATSSGTAGSTSASAHRRAAKRPAEAEPQTYATLLVGLDAKIGSTRSLVTKRDRDWLFRGNLAAALLERASLTNQIDDFERVQQVLDEAFDFAPKRVGPYDVAARYHFAVHRLGEAEKDLDQIEGKARVMPEERLTIALLRGQIAMQRGDYAAAFEHLSNVAAVNPEQGASELALYYAKTGEPAQAETLLLGALEKVDPRKNPRLRSWLRLQIARLAMDRGAYRDALERLKQADEELPGWWLVEEQVGEAYSALGEKEKALAAYQSVVDKTGLPQAMDSLAAAYEHAGRKDEAKVLIEKARALWEDHLKRLPEASMGHGLHHFLQFGPPERALELALKNYAARPGLESPVLLARAYLKVGKNAEALEIAKKALATKYVSASVHDVASKAYAAVGDTANADAEREKCFAINKWYQDTLHSH